MCGLSSLLVVMVNVVGVAGDSFYLLSLWTQLNQVPVVSVQLDMYLFQRKKRQKKKKLTEMFPSNCRFSLLIPSSHRNGHVWTSVSHKVPS